jgi:hypothetical protein
MKENSKKSLKKSSDDANVTKKLKLENTKTKNSQKKNKVDSLSKTSGLSKDSLSKTSGLSKDSLSKTSGLSKDSLSKTSGLSKDSLSKTSGLAKDSLSKTSGLSKDSLSKTSGLAKDSLSKTSGLAKDSLSKTSGLVKDSLSKTSGLADSDEKPKKQKDKQNSSIKMFTLVKDSKSNVCLIEKNSNNQVDFSDLDKHDSSEENEAVQKKKTGKKKKIEIDSNKYASDNLSDKTSSAIKVLDRDELRLNKLKKFYKNQHNLETFVNIVTGYFPKKNLSLRILDWFVTNYSKEKDIIIKYKNDHDGSVISFDVHNEYKNQLTAFGKKGYDQFCRSNKILYPYKENGKKKYVETTIAQLNFFKWAITEKIINYVVKHFDEIFKHMNDAKKRRDEERNKEGSDEEETEFDKQMNKYLSNSSVEYSLETELSTPIEGVNILEFSSSKPKLEKYIKKTRRARHEFAETKAKQLNKCTGKVKIEFK